MFGPVQNNLDAPKIVLDLCIGMWLGPISISFILSMPSTGSSKASFSSKNFRSVWDFLLCVWRYVSTMDGISNLCPKKYDTFLHSKWKMIQHTVKSRAVDRSTIQFWTIFGVLLTEMCCFLILLSYAWKNVLYQWWQNLEAIWKLTDLQTTWLIECMKILSAWSFPHSFVKHKSGSLFLVYTL